MTLRLRLTRVSGRLCRVAVIAAIVGFAVFPIYWMLVTALTANTDLFGEHPRLIPDPGQLEVFAQVFDSTPITGWLRNSTVIALGTAVSSVLLALPMAYALARYRFHGRGLLGLGLFSSQMLPEALLVVPIFQIFLALGLINQLYGLVIVNVVFVLPIVVWMLKAAIGSLPVELEDAARVDGCNTLRVQVSVVWPLILPTIAASAVIAFFVGWNEYLFAATFVSDETLRPASVGLSLYVGEFVTPPQLIMGAGLVYAIPAIAFFVLAQRHIVSGLTAGGVKG